MNQIRHPGIFAACILGCLLRAQPVLAKEPAARPDPWQAAVQAMAAKDYAASAGFLEAYLQSPLEPQAQDKARFFLAETRRLAGAGGRALALYRELGRQAQPDAVRLSARYREAEAVYNRGEFQQAAGVLGELVRDPKADFLSPQVAVLLVKANLKLGRVPEALDLFQQVVKRFPRALLDPDLHFLFGLMKEYQGQPLDALKIYAELPDDPLAQLFSGAILETQGRYLAAIEAYNRTLAAGRLPAEQELAAYLKARAFYKSGDFLSAGLACRAFFTRFTRGPLRPQAELLNLLILFSQGKFAEARSAYARVAEHAAGLPEPDQALARFLLADISLNLGQTDQALRTFADLLPQAGALRPEVLLKLAYCQGTAGRWEEAFSRLQEYARLARPPAPLSQLLILRAALETRREAEAFRALQSLTATQDPLAELGLYLMAAYFLDQGQPEKLAAQWALLEKTLSQRTPAVRYREAAAWARLLAAEAQYQLGDYVLASEYYTRALQLYPRDKVLAYALAGLTWCAFQAQDYAETLKRSERFARLPSPPPSLPAEILLLRAHAFFNLQDYPEAIAAYREWLNVAGGAPQAPAVRFQIGWARYLHKDYLDAVETWNDLARRYPGTPEADEALFWVADTYFQAGENPRAREVYERLLAAEPPDDRRRAYELRIAQTFYNQEQDDEAIRRFTALMENDPNSAEAAEAGKGIEAASYRIADRLNAIPAFREFVAKFPGSTLAEDIQYRIGEAFFQKERYADSLESFAEFILTYTKSPRTPNAQYYVAVCQEALGQTAEAAQQAQAFIQNYPQHELAPEMTFRLASWEFELGRFADAAGHFAACGEQYPLPEYQPRAWFNAAVAYEKLQLPEPAVRYYERLVTAYPDDPNAAASLARLALLQAQLKNPQASEQALARLRARGMRELLQKTRLALAAWYAEQGDSPQRERLLLAVKEEGLPKSEAYSLALVELAAVYEERKDWRQALGVYRRLAKVATEAKWRDASRKRIRLLQRILEQP